MAQSVYEQTIAYTLLQKVFEAGCEVTPELKHDIEKLFSPAKIVEGQRVRHKKTGKCGVVYKISQSKERVMVTWDGQRWAEGYTKVEMLEVIE